MQLARIDRRRTREEVGRVLRELIATGQMSAGARVDEVRLSEQLGVSRTPVREAIIALEHEGWLRSAPNKGARVVAADTLMVRELYPILGALEAEAVQLSGQALIDNAERLFELIGRLVAERRRAEQHRLDREFHRTLAEHCGNSRLLRLINQHWALARRFDGAFERGTANHTGTCEEHRQIAAAVRSRELAFASELLRQHWQHGIEVVCAWL